MRLSTWLKIVVVCALALGFWRLTGNVGLIGVTAGVMMLGVPMAIARYGRRLGDPVISGMLGGGIGWTLLAVGWSTIGGSRTGPVVIAAFLATGLVVGLLQGISYAVGDAVSGRPRPRSRRLAYKFDVALALLLIATIAASQVVAELHSAIFPGATPFTPPAPGPAPSITSAVRATVQ
jgi:hypothetical protein